MLKISSVVVQIQLGLNLMQMLLISPLSQKIDPLSLNAIILSRFGSPLSAIKVQIGNFQGIHSKLLIITQKFTLTASTDIVEETVNGIDQDVCMWVGDDQLIQQNYNNMSDNQTLSLLNNDTENRHFLQSSEYREASVKDESVHNLDINQSPKDMREVALNFLNTYTKIDEVFPINTLKQSASLKVKHYKESLFYGDIHNGKKHGLGVMIYTNQRIYEGEWFHDQKKGYGAQKFPNGCFYKGQYISGKPGGVGSYLWPNGESYDGEWMNGFKHGSGMWRGQKGDAYKGQWRFGKPQGYGVHTWPNGDCYQGEFKQCLKHGEGIEKFANGDIYKGRYVNGKPSSYGEYYWANGSVFKGNFVNGLRDGKGQWKRNVGNSDRYEGQYKNDKKWGYGVFTWASGNVFKGNYEADLRNGIGQMYWVNGSYYKGEWRNGIQHGEGEIYIPGVGFKKGMFENNVIVEVWEEKLIGKDANKNGSGRKKTQENHVGRNKTSFRSRDSNRGKKLNNTQVKNQRQLHLQRSLLKERLDTRKRQEHSQRYQRSLKMLTDKKPAHKDPSLDRPFFSNAKVFPVKEKLNTSMNVDHVRNNKLQSSSTKNNHSRERLLHSSFYLYKLNLRHNNQTLKSFKRSDLNDEDNHKPTMLFKGKID